MKHFLFVIIFLTACSCSHSPVGSAEHDLSVLQKNYDTARGAEVAYDMLPLCKLEKQVGCSTDLLMATIRTLGYNAEAALTIAEGERTDKAISEARISVTEYVTSIP